MRIFLQCQHVPPARLRYPSSGDPDALDWGGDDIGVLLDLAGDAHVHVLITDRDDHSSDQRWVDLGRQLDALVGLQERLENRKTKCIKIQKAN